ncbi:ferric reduction oxidase 4-like [Bidens hawaiensis]|uniref:ferric reduction oxidase 4-like n=1 Tax=Bidens hawaiensis TaxID=980011 RepID=UPI00404901E1
MKDRAHRYINKIGDASCVCGVALYVGYAANKNLLKLMDPFPLQTPKLHLFSRTNSTYFREQGTNLALFSFPIMFLASLGCIYLHFQAKHVPKRSFTRRSRWLDFWKRPLIVMNPLGIVSVMAVVFSAMFVVLLGWSLYHYLHVSFAHLMMHGVDEKVWTAKFRSVSLRLGYIGNITWAFLFFPVTRGSSLLRLVGLTSESSIKYHIWLGHVSMVLFALHSVGFIIYWGITDKMYLVLLQLFHTYLKKH